MLSIEKKIQMMINQIQEGHKMLNRVDLHDDVRQRVIADLAVWQVELRELYIDLLKVQTC
jgi:hypothetical protein